MKQYQIFVTTRAKKELKKLPPKDQQRIHACIRTLGLDPFRGKQLQGDLEGNWSVRVWPYRVVYKIQKQIVTVTVLKIGHRKDVYR
jgi:mRNA interferase RelE/StbE